MRETLREVRAAHEAAHEKRMDACAAAAETAPAEAPAQEVPAVEPAPTAEEKALVDLKLLVDTTTTPAAAQAFAVAQPSLADYLASCQVEIRKVAGLWGEAVIRAGKNIGAVGVEKVAGDRRWVARQAYETVEETTASIVVTFGDTKEQAVDRFAAAWARENSE